MSAYFETIPNRPRDKKLGMPIDEQHRLAKENAELRAEKKTFDRRLNELVDAYDALKTNTRGEFEDEYRVLSSRVNCLLDEIANLKRQNNILKKAKGITISESVKLSDFKGTIAQKLGFSVAEIEGNTRYRPVVRARQIFCYLARAHTPRSYKQISGAIGGRDHTTSIHAADTVHRLRSVDSDIDTVIREIEAEFDLPDSCALYDQKLGGRKLR